jgi:hypothetical protein
VVFRIFLLAMREMEKEKRVFALALTLALFKYPEGELNPHSIATTGV